MEDMASQSVPSFGVRIRAIVCWLVAAVMFWTGEAGPKKNIPAATAFCIALVIAIISIAFYSAGCRRYLPMAFLAEAACAVVGIALVFSA